MADFIGENIEPPSTAGDAERGEFGKNHINSNGSIQIGERRDAPLRGRRKGKTFPFLGKTFPFLGKPFHYFRNSLNS